MGDGAFEAPISILSVYEPPATAVLQVGVPNVLALRQGSHNLFHKVTVIAFEANELAHVVLLWTKTDLHPRRDTGQEGSVTDGELHDEVQDVQAEAAECHREEHEALRQHWG